MPEAVPTASAGSAGSASSIATVNSRGGRFRASSSDSDSDSTSYICVSSPPPTLDPGRVIGLDSTMIGIGPVVSWRLTYSLGSPSGVSSAITSTAAMRERSNACSSRSRPWMSCSICWRASSRRRASSLSTRSRYDRASLTMSRPCCLAICTSASASADASWRRRAASISASSRRRWASSVVSLRRRAEPSSALVRICAAPSRAVCRMRAASSPSSRVAVSSSMTAASAGPACRADPSSRSRKRSRSWRRAISAATIRRKSRTSDWS